MARTGRESMIAGLQMNTDRLAPSLVAMYIVVWGSTSFEVLQT
jgi:hypothetical protein